MAAEPLSPEEEAALRSQFAGFDPESLSTDEATIVALLATLDAARRASDAQVAGLRGFLELRPHGTVGPERIPWFIHCGISHAEGAECVVCRSLAGTSDMRAEDGLWLTASMLADLVRGPYLRSLLEDFGSGRTDADHVAAWLMGDLRALASTPAPQPECVECFEPSHDIDYHDHHWHDGDHTVFVGPSHAPAPQPATPPLDPHERTQAAIDENRRLRDEIEELRARLAEPHPEPEVAEPPDGAFHEDHEDASYVLAEIFGLKRVKRREGQWIAEFFGGTEMPLAALVAARRASGAQVALPLREECSECHCPVGYHVTSPHPSAVALGDCYCERYAELRRGYLRAAPTPQPTTHRPNPEGGVRPETGREACAVCGEDWPCSQAPQPATPPLDEAVRAYVEARRAYDACEHIGGEEPCDHWFAQKAAFDEMARLADGASQ